MTTTKRRDRVMNIHTLAERKFHSFAFTGDWKTLFGEPERNFRAMLYGASTCGKSTFALQFADYLALHFGKVFYNSFEEGLNQTLRDRAAFVKPRSKKLFVGDRVRFENMVKRIKSCHYRFIIIDSVQFANFTYDQYQQLTDLFPKKSFIFISQASAFNKTDGANRILFATDCKLYFKNGTVISSSRFNAEDGFAQLYIPKSREKVYGGGLFPVAEIETARRGIPLFNPKP